MVQSYQQHTLRHAKTMRGDPTPAEKRLWARLRSRQLSGQKFRRQQPIGPYIADFFCAAARLIVEADGDQHADNAYDAQRDAWLKQQGYRVLRFWNHEVFENEDGVIADIFHALEAPHPSPTPTRQQAAKSSYPLPQGERKEPSNV